ncbi:hypothetical protein CONLIGDRAFT_656191 [Coniochaeta ligniaria NRRL 30616]|uniref:Rhodopsin domain-containing protein n=1 Tax=Coniochaeta ligniaria NRRL 30616 TaxID=1408157 RepID=A0A1J7IHI2_9PEZI|nr:hypothetical protein CONLIGDRAFT_656191 [Coniochaeta ligniaria NRRL 30616]
MASTSTTAEVGLMPPPDGVIPDFHRNTDLQHTLIVVYCVTFGLASLALALRLYTRAFIVKNAGLDEPIIFLAWGVSLAFFITSVKAMPAGFGRHMYDVTAIQLQGYLDLLLVLALTYIWPPTLTKLAILVLYWRINPSRIFRGCILATAVMLLGYTITFSVLFGGPCNPLATGSGVCLNNIAIAQAVLNIVTDAIIIVLPIPTIHNLNMPVKQRIQVGVILALGSAACVASIVRVSYVKAMQANPDVTWTQASAAVWSCLELNLGILCNCLALLKPFVRRHLPFLAGSSSGATTGAGKPEGNSQQSDKSFAKRSKKPWDRLAGGKHSYQLHSVGRPGDELPAGKKGIVVVDQFEVEVVYKPQKEDGLTGDGGSTDSILGPAQSGHRAI